MMDLEWALEDLITSINPTAKINLMEVFSMFGRSATYFNQLKQIIEMENYDSKEDMERILNKYATGSRPRITQEEYDQLFDLLYPPVYDIPTTIPEVQIIGPGEVLFLLQERNILEAKNKRLEDGLQAVLRADIQSLAYALYPEDFTDINNITLEL